MLPAAVHVKMPVGIKTIVPPPVEIGAGGVIVTIAVVPLIKVIGLVGAIVAALAIVGAAAVVASNPEYLMFVNVGLPVQLSSTPLAGVPNAGVVKVGEASVGLVPNTSAPDPVSPVTADAKFALVGVAKKVATFAPNPLIPVATGRPIQLVNVPD
jgi:hypothetical protein